MDDNSTSIVISARDETKAAFDAVQRSLGALNTSVASLPGIGTALTAALGAGSFTAIIGGSVQAMAKLHDLSIQSGATVESLSGMKLAAKLAGVEMDDVAKMAQKLAISLGEAKLKGGEKAKLFEALGIDPKTSKDSGQALFELAKRLNEMGDRTKALAVMRELLGKGVSAEFINELGQQSELIAKITTAQSAQAKEFENNMVRLRSGAGQVGIAIANAMLPPMSEVVQFSLRIKEEWGAIAAILFGLGGGTILKIFGVELDEAKRATTETAEAFRDLAKARDKLDNQQRGAAQNSIIPGMNDLRRSLVESAQRDVDAAEKRLNSAIARQRELSAQASAESARVKNRPRNDLADGALGSQVAFSFDVYEEYIHLAKLADAEWAEIIKQRVERQREANREFDQEIAAIDRHNEAVESLIRKRREDGEATQLEIDLAGQSAAVIKARVEMLDAERLGLERNGQAWSDLYAITLKAAENREQIKAMNDETKRGEEFARSMGLTFTSAFEDAVIGGKRASDVLKGLGQDIERIVLRRTVTEPLGKEISGLIDKSGIGNGLGSFFSNLFGGARAGGGSVSAGRMYLVGERGPELFAPGASGSIVPNGAGGVSIVQHINIDSRSDRASIAAAMVQAKDAAKAEILASMQRGGVFA